MTTLDPVSKDESKSTIPRPSLQNLSDLIFGLALSIGAIELLGQQLTDFNQIIVSLSLFGVGFLLLVSVWYRYASIMKILPFETSTLVILNLFLLFLVAIEPYLLNLTISASQNGLTAIRNPVSQLYALDFGSIYVILAYFLHQLAVEQKTLGRTSHANKYRNSRTFYLVIAAIFYVSITPYWSFAISYFSLRQLMWLFFVPISLIFRAAHWIR